MSGRARRATRPTACLFGALGCNDCDRLERWSVLGGLALRLACLLYTSANAGEQSLTLDAIEYAPVRNVVGHTGLLTDNGKGLLRLKYENIKARVKKLVAEKPPTKKKSGAKNRARRK